MATYTFYVALNEKVELTEESDTSLMTLLLFQHQY